MWHPREKRGGTLGAVALALAFYQTAHAVDQEGVIVLQSGGILQGTISRSGERYVVTRPKSVVDVPTAQVLLVAETLEDAYDQQRKRLPSDGAEAHLRLAEWCLRYNLVQHADAELADARRLDPRDPRVDLLERRLTVASHRIKPQSAEPATSSHEEDATNAELRNLDAFAAGLPVGVVERFTRKVQPLLVNNCTTSGCHQPGGKQEFQLDRAVLHGLSNRRTTLRNLAATLELVNRNAPQQSELLKIPRRSHGGMNRPILGPRQEEQLVQLVDWVAIVTDTNDLAEPLVSRPKEMPRGVVVADEFPAPSLWLKNPPAAVDGGVVPASADETTPVRPTRDVQIGAELKPWRPRDAFDPEIFNRQTREAAKASAAVVELPASR